MRRIPDSVRFPYVVVLPKNADRNPSVHGNYYIIDQKAVLWQTEGSRTIRSAEPFVLRVYISGVPKLLHAKGPKPAVKPAVAVEA